MARKQFTAALICIIMLALTGCVRQERRVQIHFEPSAAGTYKVMTFNIRTARVDDGPNNWEFRKDAVYKLLAQEKADVVGMQEVVDKQYKDIKKALPLYESVSFATIDGKKQGEANSIFFRGDRFELVDSGRFWFSNTPWDPNSTHWGNQLARNCAWVRLSERASGKVFYVYNLHMDHKSQPSRVQSAHLLAKEIAARGSKDPYVVMGDFNMPLDNPGMLYLQKIGADTPYPKLTDAWQLVYPDQKPKGTAHGFEGRTTGRKIDHILVTEGTQVLDSQIITRQVDGRWPSDHFPFTATIRVP